MSAAAGPQPATPHLARLEPFVGSWTTEGEVINPAAAPLKFAAKDVYRWLPGGRFLLHEYDADMPDGKVQGIELIGEGSSGGFAVHTFDSSGEISVMWAREDAGVWTFEGERLRFTGGFQENAAKLAGRWARRLNMDSPWLPLMDVRLKKTSL